jgi:hypothetical protein
MLLLVRVDKFVFHVLAPYGVLFFSNDEFSRDTSLVQGLIRVQLCNLKVFLALADDLCCVWFICAILGVTQVSGDRD